MLTILTSGAPEDALSDDIESYQSIMLPPPELGNLPEIDHVMRAASITQAGRDALSKFVIREEYIPKLIPLVTMAEDLESLSDLHRLCNIMKSLILLNDNTIIETVVTDPIILGVVGALECAYTEFLWTDGVADGFKMTPSFQRTKRTTDNTSQINRATRKLYLLRMR